MQIIAFQLGKMNFGIPINDVIEILPSTNTVRVPISETKLIDVANIRNKSTSIYHLDKLLDLEPFEISDPYFIVLNNVVNNAIIVNGVPETLDIEICDIEKNFNSEYITGVIEKNDRMIIILKLKEL